MPHADEIRKQLEEEKANEASASAADDSSKSVAEQVTVKFTTEDGEFDYPAYQNYLKSLNDEKETKADKQENVVLYNEKEL